jgi:hypothetical protein
VDECKPLGGGGDGGGGGGVSGVGRGIMGGDARGFAGIEPDGQLLGRGLHSFTLELNLSNSITRS